MNLITLLKNRQLGKANKKEVIVAGWTADEDRNAPYDQEKDYFTSIRGRKERIEKIAEEMEPFLRERHEKSKIYDSFKVPSHLTYDQSEAFIAARDKEAQLKAWKEFYKAENDYQDVAKKYRKEQFYFDKNIDLKTTDGQKYWASEEGQIRESRVKHDDYDMSDFESGLMGIPPKHRKNFGSNRVDRRPLKGEPRYYEPIWETWIIEKFAEKKRREEAEEDAKYNENPFSSSYNPRPPINPNPHPRQRVVYEDRDERFFRLLSEIPKEGESKKRPREDEEETQPKSSSSSSSNAGRSRIHFYDGDFEKLVQEVPDYDLL